MLSGQEHLGLTKSLTVFEILVNGPSCGIGSLRLLNSSKLTPIQHTAQWKIALNFSKWILCTRGGRYMLPIQLAIYGWNKLIKSWVVFHTFRVLKEYYGNSFTQSHNRVRSCSTCSLFYSTVHGVGKWLLSYRIVSSNKALLKLH